MSNSGRETEAKFYVLHLEETIARLQRLQAHLVQPRVLETNLRFDLPDFSLTSAGRVVRLRRDTESRLTYKGPGEVRNGILDRQEIEFVVGDHEKTRHFLEALGYRKSAYYEKYRATYELDQTMIMLDELPYGRFVEVEGESVDQIQVVAASLGLDWSAAIQSSYTALFETLRKTLQLTFQDISFENFQGLKITSSDLHVRAADG